MPGTERTLVLIKPDGVQRQLVGRILARYEERGLKLVGLKLVHVDRDARRAALRRASRQAVLRGPRRLHHLGAARRPRLRRPERDRRRPRDQRRDPPARGGAGHDPRRLRARDGAEHRPRLGQPGGRRERARAVVRARRAARLRARRRPLGARPERVGGAERRPSGSSDLDRLAAARCESIGETISPGTAERRRQRRRRPPVHRTPPADVASASPPSRTATAAVVNARLPSQAVGSPSGGARSRPGR